MTPKEFADLFPGRPFAIRWVERGDHGARAFFWHVVFTSDYWTSDSWREVYDHHRPDCPDGKGETLEAAFADLIKKTHERALKTVEYQKKKLLESEQELRDVEAKVLR